VLGNIIVNLFLSSRLGSLTLRSPAFGDLEPIPPPYTCEGKDISPPLSWEGAPNGVKSFALVLERNTEGRIHWLVYDISPLTVSLPQDLPKLPNLPLCKQGKNSMGRVGYTGPCEKDTYTFRLFALGVRSLGVPPGASPEEVLPLIRRHTLASASLRCLMH